MAHDYHEAQPGYSPAQILCDGYGECAARSASAADAIARLDNMNFLRAWVRAAEWNRDGLADVSEAERPLLNALWATQLQFERLGVPIGTLPVGVSS